MQNPWIDLPETAPYVLPGDAPLIERFNRTASDKTRIHTDALPEPFVGRLDAPILTLLLNPGFDGSEPEVHRDPRFSEPVRACLRQEPAEYPHYYLSPGIIGPGVPWNRRVLKPLIEGFGLKTVSQNVAALEYFPYHSVTFGHHRLRVPSQEFGFEMLREAIRRDAIIFVTRGLKIWTAAVPELATYRRMYTTRSVQNVVISERNCPNGFEQAKSLLSVRCADPDAAAQPRPQRR